MTRVLQRGEPGRAWAGHQGHSARGSTRRPRCAPCTRALFSDVLTLGADRLETGRCCCRGRVSGSLCTWVWAWAAPAAASARAFSRPLALDTLPSRLRGVAVSAHRLSTEAPCVGVPRAVVADFVFMLGAYSRRVDVKLSRAVQSPAFAAACSASAVAVATVFPARCGPGFGHGLPRQRLRRAPSRGCSALLRLPSCRRKTASLGNASRVGGGVWASREGRLRSQS